MRSIGIITTHRANNFGAVLQAYSLVKACQELGAQAEIIDWHCPFYEWQYHRAVRYTPNPLAMVRHFLWHVFRESGARKLFEDFRSRLPKSYPIRTRADLESVGARYDKYIVGSDQVWNPRNSSLIPEKFDRAFLLDFVKGRSKNAFAASIGVKSIEPQGVRSEFVEALRTFDQISMREHEGSAYVASLLGSEIDTVLDPVLLHDCVWWSRLVKNQRQPSTPCVFEYNVRGVSGLDAFAQKAAAIRGTSVVKPIIPSFSHVRDRALVPMGPSEFVSEIAHAACVVTSSFHASALSVIFGKKLFLIKRKDSSDPNSRFTSLFRFAKLEENIVEETDQYKIVEIDCQGSDYKGLEKVREFSLGVLRHICLD